MTRSGCYLTHDSKMYREAFAEVKKRKPGLDNLGPGLVAAFEVWAYVQSRPEAKKAILTVGKRDISYDADLPVPLKWVRPRNGVGAADIAELGAGPCRDRAQRPALPHDGAGGLAARRRRHGRRSASRIPARPSTSGR